MATTENGQPMSNRSLGSPSDFKDDTSAQDALNDVGATHGSTAASTPSAGQIGTYKPAGA